MLEVVLGIDLGTQGARILAVDAAGTVIAQAHEPLPARSATLPAGWFEQDPRDWWQAVCKCFSRLAAELPSGTKIAGISVDSTSGTLLPVDAAGEPLHPALMYNDQRSEPQVPTVQQAGAAHQQKFGYRFGSSYALPKILWFKQVCPDLFARTHRFIHAADFIVGRLTGDYSSTDTSNALKTGYDLINLRWPDFIESDLAVPLDILPRPVLPGTQLGVVSQARADMGLTQGIPVFAGATDGAAAQIASGAARPGDWNATLGTTLVFKGISRKMILDPLGRVYFHLHPEGWWMPGGASNTGTEWILNDHPGADLNELNRLASACIPTPLVRYPLAKRGERFPFIYTDAQGFLLGSPIDLTEKYASGLEGVALVERLAYETLQKIGLEVGERIYITGGGSKSLLWSQVRASVLHKTLLQPAVTETAFGAAVIAASGCWYPTISQAAGQMVKISQSIEPNAAWQPAYEDRYAVFIDELKRRGYLDLQP